MKTTLRSIGVIVVACSLAGAQSFISVPDSLPSSGPCNAAPFGYSAMTYLCRIPAAFLNPAEPYIDDLAFTSCTSGTITAYSMQMGIGHVPSPLPQPFLFPSFDSAGVLTTLGNLLDYTPIWNSVSQGPFVWTFNSSMWARMGFGPTGGTGFVWNGMDDVGIYITFQNAVGTTSFHRTSTEPFRVFAVGFYQGTISLTNDNSGARIQLTVRPVAPPSSITQSGPALIGQAFILQLLSPGDPNGSFACGFALGTVPGIGLSDGRIIPLNPDPLLFYSLTPANGIFFNNLGVLNASGIAGVPVVVPNQPSLAGGTLHAAFIVADPGNPTGVGTISPSHAITLQ